MFPGLIPPMLAADRPSPMPVLLAAAFVLGAYMLYCGIGYLRTGKIKSRQGHTLTPQQSPILYWFNVSLAAGGGAVLIVMSLAMLWYTRYR
jgi:hypothetical protein